MAAIHTKGKRNLLLECFKLLAAVMVVFVHAQFPGKLHTLVNCLVRFAIPLFFAVAGYFSFGLSALQVRRRLVHTLKLNLCGAAAFLFFGLAGAALGGESLLAALRGVIPSLRGIAGIFFLHTSPYGGHLWYLVASAALYVLFWGYTAFFGEEKIDYRPLYLLSASLLCIRYGTDLFKSVGYGVPYHLFRDGLFIGLPMFSMGLFLREHVDRLIANYRLTPRRLALIFLFGVALSALQWKCFTESELPVGAVIQTAAMILFAMRCPDALARFPRFSRAAACFGPLSLWIYILHMGAIDLYPLLLRVPARAALGALEPWLRPVLILLFACVLSIPCICLSILLRRRAARRMR